ncbi:MAG TPA: glycosyltransferase family 39 protein [Gemmatimonadales bacterium]|nr:glycosyltransferase family 39 protein [Gemmatimonadales bacterium]
MLTHPVALTLIAVLVAAALAARAVPLRWASAVESALGHRLTPWVIGLGTALACWWVAGATFHVEPISTDEAAYLLQARIFAAGHLTAPAPPIPDFFAQAWVVVTPRLFAKYPPGTSLVLVPGLWLGLPWLVPCLLDLVSGALLFTLLRRAIGAPAALVTWAAWVLSGMTMQWQTGYFSEVPLLACWLGSVACAWRWIDGGRRRWLLVAAACAGFGALTRPLSILLLGLPLAVAVWRSARRSARWRDVGMATLVAVGFVLTIPPWNAATTGHPLRSPLREYTEDYLPWDRVGFAIDSTAPLLPTPPDLEGIAPQLARVHREHTLARLPRTLFERALWVSGQLFTHWRPALALLALVGIWRLGGAAWVGLWAALAEFLGHAVWGHQAGWTLYYAEGAAAWYVPGAVGLVAVVGWLVRRTRPDTEAAPRAALAAVVLLPLLLWLSVAGSRGYREWRTRRAADSRAFTEMVAAGPGHAIYFVRYGTPAAGRPALIRNDPWLAGARDWIVYDLGPRNDELLRLAPDRAAFLVDVAARRVTPLREAPPPATPR